jgi:muramoyltetrapeptide carboxypeptidase
MKIGVVAPAGRIAPETAARVETLARTLYPTSRLEISFHPQCFASDGHFAGDDAMRSQAFLEIANDPGVDALWWARGGYGACRLAEAVVPQLAPAAKAKAYMGYSDAGSLLAALYGQGFERVVHGPMVNDIVRDGGAAAVERALRWLVDADPAALDPVARDARAPIAAFNMAILASLLGTPLLPDLAGHEVMLEEVSEHMYRIDRMLFQITSSPAIRAVAGLRLGRCSDVPENDPDFGMTAEEVLAYWCERSGIAYLGRADIGHDAANKVVPFGRAWR